MVNDFQTDVTIHVFFIKYHREMIADTVFNNDGCFYGWNWKEIASSAHRYNFPYHMGHMRHVDYHWGELSIRC